MHSVAVNLDPGQYLAAWREQAGTLFLPRLSGARVGEPVAVRINIQGRAIGATIFGKVALVRRVGRPALPPGVELQLERHSLPAAAFLSMAARGEPVTFRERSPRWSVERNVALEHGGSALELTTVNVSDDGCALRWFGEPPRVGHEIGIRLKEGFFAPVVRGVVCWTHTDAGESSVGIRIVVAGRGGRAWRSLVDEVARSGALAT